MSKWPLTENLPEPKFKPLLSMMAPPGFGRSFRKSADRQADAQLRAWREATGREAPQRIEGPLMPLDQTQHVMRALGRKTLRVMANEL